MKHFILLIVFILGCTKYYNDDIMRNAIIEDFFKSLYLPYEYRIKIKTPTYSLNYCGKKNALKQFTLKGDFNILNEKQKYNVYYNGINWYDIKTEQILEGNQPLNPVEFIENMLRNCDIQFLRQESNIFVYKAKLNLVMISPMDYEKIGIIKIKMPERHIIEIYVNEKDIDMNIKLLYKNNIYFNIKTQIKDSIKITHYKDIVKKRLLFGLGFLKNGYAKFYEKNKYNTLIVNVSNIKFMEFQYIEPGIDKNEKYLFDDLRNTVKADNEININFNNTNIYIEEKGVFFNIIIENVKTEKLNNGEKICAAIDNICFPVKILNNKMIIMNIKREIIKQFYAILFYPFEK